VNVHTFVSELEKLSAVAFGPKDATNYTAAGVFVSGGQAEADRATELLKKTKSMNKTLEQLHAEYPGAFITSAYKREHAPKDPGKLKKFLQTITFRRKRAQEKLDSAKASFAERSKSPRVFVRSGRAGGPEQSAFYKEVARGLYDRELNQPHVRKRDRVVYS
jgi:hypothetical protein